jgi:hypothetical protein
MIDRKVQSDLEVIWRKALKLREFIVVNERLFFSIQIWFKIAFRQDFVVRNIHFSGTSFISSLFISFDSGRSIGSTDRSFVHRSIRRRDRGFV